MNDEHLKILKSGATAWNKWREKNRNIRPDLERINISLGNIFGIQPMVYADDMFSVDLRGANLSGANLSHSDLSLLNLDGANLSRASLFNSDLSWARLSGADLSGANLSLANFSEADLSGANLSNAELIGASLVGTNINAANLNHCKVYGINVWDIKGDTVNQKNLVITRNNQSEVTVDNIKVAQFIYLLLENTEVRNVIDTLTSKSVLILGRFTEKRKKVLDVIKDLLRKEDYLPILFDFTRPVGKNMIATVETLARISKFAIVDLTNSRDVRREIESISRIENLPIRPIVLKKAANKEYSWFRDYLGKKSILWPFEYNQEEEIGNFFRENILTPAEEKYEELKQNLLEIQLRISRERRI